MTRYILENLEARGTFYVRTLDPYLPPPHTMEVTDMPTAAAGFDSMIEANNTALRLRGRWEPKPV